MLIRRFAQMLVALCFVGSMASGFGAGASAQEAGPIDESSVKKHYPTEGPQGEKFIEIAKELRCPTCTGLSVLESDAKFSVQIKDIVQEQVEQGKSKDEVLKYFTERYGPWILRAPPTKGFNMIAWALPLAVMVFGPVLIWFFVWRKRKVVSTLGVRSSDAIIAEMNEALQALRSGGKV